MNLEVCADCELVECDPDCEIRRDIEAEAECDRRLEVVSDD